MGRPPDWRPRTHGQKNSTLVSSKKREYDRDHPVARLDNPAPEELRSCIRDGYCWWCGRGGWKSLSGHTSRAHGISAAVIRDLAGLFGHIPTCTPELSHSKSVQMKQLLMEGLRVLPRAKSGHRMRRTVAGLKYQVEVKTPRLLANRPKAMETLARLRLSGRHFGQPVKPHDCPVCGTRIAYAHPLTCSPECRKIVRQETARKAVTGRVYTPDMRQRMSEGAKMAFARGRRINPNPCQPHPCRICGTIIPQARPRLCSPACRKKAHQEVCLLIHPMRVLKITKADRSVVVSRYLSGESGTLLAKEYGISVRYVLLLAKSRQQGAPCG